MSTETTGYCPVGEGTDTSLDDITSAYTLAGKFSTDDEFHQKELASCGAASWLACYYPSVRLTTLPCERFERTGKYCDLDPDHAAECDYCHTARTDLAAWKLGAAIREALPEWLRDSIDHFHLRAGRRAFEQGKQFWSWTYPGSTEAERLAAYNLREAKLREKVLAWLAKNGITPWEV